jgi:fructose-1,6-bisphosphatase
MAIYSRHIATGAVKIAEVAPNAVGTEELVDGAVTTAKLASEAATKSKIGYKVVAVTVAADSNSGSSDADADLVGGQIIGIYPTGNQDQFVTNVTLNANGSVTVTLAGNATNDNTFNVVVLKP